MDEELKRVGAMLNQFYILELHINQLITRFFKPVEEQKFQKFMLNTSITPYGGKVKILRHLIEIDSKTFDNLHELGRIRNGIAHVAPYYLLEESETGKNEIKSKIPVMKGDGKIVSKDFWEWSTRFNNIMDNVLPVILRETKKLK